MANEKGVWRTIGGRRVFIKDGQDLASAMRESGKFNTSKKETKKEDKYKLYDKFEYKDGQLTAYDSYGKEVDSYGLSKEDYEENPKYWQDKFKEETNREAMNEINSSDIKLANELRKETEKKYNSLKEKQKNGYGISKEDLEDFVNNSNYQKRDELINSDKEFKKQIDSALENYNMNIKDMDKKAFEDAMGYNKEEFKPELGKDRIDKRYDTEFYNNEIDKISKMDSLDDRKQAIRRLEERTGTDRKVIQDALDEKDYDKHLGEEYERRFGKEKEERAKTNENYRDTKTSSDKTLKELAEKRYGSSEEDFNKLIKEKLGVDKSQKDYDNLKDQVSKVYKEEMSKKNELLNNQEFKKLVKDTYGDMQQVREMGLSVDQVKKQILSDVNDEIDYWKHQDKDYWKDVNANPKQQVKAYENLKKFITNYGENTTNQAMNDTLRNAFNDYRKKHKNSNMSFTEFMRINKK